MLRRDFLRLSTYAGGGLMLALSSAGRLGAAMVVHEQQHFPARWPIGHFIAIDPQGRVTVQIVKHEMGQGVSTSCAAIVAEEMGADWEQVDVRLMSHTEAYSFSTGGSNTIKSWFTDLRKAGALGRDLLCRVAATRWGVDASECRTDSHRVLHRDGRSAGFAELAQEASRLGFPRDFAQFLAAETRLKPSAEFKLVGTPFPRKNVAHIVQGTYRYGLDAPDDGLVAVIVRSPDFRGRLKSFDAESVANIAGIHALVPIRGLTLADTNNTFVVREGVAIVADSMWTATKARNALKVEWETPLPPHRDNAGYDAACLQKLQRLEGEPLRENGDWSSLPSDEPLLDRSYIFPHQTHASMEPLNTTARVRGEDVEVWAGHQSPRLLIVELERHLGCTGDRVTVHCFPSGGSFGRRYSADVGIEAVQIARAVEPRAVKLVWTREDDLRYGLFHFQHNVRHRVWVDGEGRISGWHMADLRNWGREHPWNLAYAVPRWRYHEVDARAEAPLPSCAWRGVTSPGWGFAFESAIDEVAHALGADPVEYRLRNMPATGNFELGPGWTFDWARLRGVLELAAERAGWHRAPPPGHARGVAVAPYSDKGYCANVVEATLVDGEFRVTRVTSVVDIGLVVDPDNAHQQVVGSVIWGLTAALYGGVPIRDGVAQWSSFADNRVLRIGECPPIDVHFVEGGDRPPLGLGEIPVPPLAPAVANAYFALTGTRVRQLPLPLRVAPASTARAGDAVGTGGPDTGGASDASARSRARHNRDTGIFTDASDAAVASIASTGGTA